METESKPSDPVQDEGEDQQTDQASHTAADSDSGKSATVQNPMPSPAPSPSSVSSAQREKLVLQKLNQRMNELRKQPMQPQAKTNLQEEEASEAPLPESSSSVPPKLADVEERLRAAIRKIKMEEKQTPQTPVETPTPGASKPPLTLAQKKARWANSVKVALQNYSAREQPMQSATPVAPEEQSAAGSLTKPMTKQQAAEVQAFQQLPKPLTLEQKKARHDLAARIVIDEFKESQKAEKQAIQQQNATPQTDDPYREFARRQHRMLGAYAALKAWELGVECVWVDRVDLGKYLGLEKIRAERTDWLRGDLQAWFPQVEFWYFEDWLSYVTLSRVPVAELPLPKKTRESFLSEHPWAATPTKMPEIVEAGFQGYMSALPPAGFDRANASPKAAKLLLPKAGLTEAALASILNRLSIGLPPEAS